MDEKQDEFKFSFAVDVRADGDGEKKTRFADVAYSGGIISDHWYWDRVAIDLSSMEDPGKIPALLDHNSDDIVGYTNSFSIDNQMNVTGTLSGSTAAAKKVADLSDEGFPWQMSLRVKPGEIMEVAAGQSIQLNGQTMHGPLSVFKNNRVREVSFTAIGADDKTSAMAFAALNDRNKGDKNMSDLDDLKDLKAKFAALEVEKAAEKARADDAESKMTEFSAAAKKEQVEALFSDIGKDYTDADAAPYLAMSSEQISAIKGQFSAFKANLPDYLFNADQNKGQESSSINPLLENAKARAGG